MSQGMYFWSVLLRTKEIIEEGRVIGGKLNLSLERLRGIAKQLGIKCY